MAYFQAFGLSCPDGGKFYVCEHSTVPFIGCCTTDPCAGGSGTCPKANLRTASFSGDSYSELPEQDCNAPEGRNIWYTCKATRPTFMGCCNVNPCVKGSCPRDSLVPAKLSDREINRNLFLNPTASISTPTASPSSSKSPSTSGAANSPTTSAAPNVTGTEQQSSGLSTGAIAGIAVGVGALFLILIALLMYKFGWSAGKRRERKKAPMLPQMAQSDYEPSEAGPFYDNKSNRQPSPYRDSYMSSSTALGSPRSTMFAKQQQQMSGSDVAGAGLTGGAGIGEADPRQPSPAYSQHSYHSRTPSGGVPANLPVVYEMDSAMPPQELPSNHQGGSLYSPHTQTSQGQQLQQPGPGHSRGPSFDTPMTSPGHPPESPLVSDAEAASQYGSPVGSPRLPSHGGYVSLPMGEPNIGPGSGLGSRPGRDDDAYIPYSVQPGPRQ